MGMDDYNRVSLTPFNSKTSKRSGLIHTSSKESENEVFGEEWFLVTRRVERNEGDEEDDEILLLGSNAQQSL